MGGPAVVDSTCSDGGSRKPCRLVLIGSSDGKLYAFNATDPDDVFLEWRFGTKDKVWSTPTVADGVAYFGSLDHHVYAVRIEDGTLKWKTETKGGVVASPVVVGGRLYVGSFDSVFYALDAATGQEVWRFTGADNWYWGRAVVHESTVYAPSLDGNLYALDIATGERQWALDTGKRIVGSPVVVLDMIAVASDDGSVRLARLKDGLQKGACTIEKKIRTPLVHADGVIYLGVRDHSIRALLIKPSGNPDEEWVYRTKDDEVLPGSAC